MLIDARTLPHDTVVHADVCVVGGGPAGITVAAELLSTGKRVCILESGAMTVERRPQSLAAAESVGMSYYRIDTTRFRALGGTSHRWISARARPLDRLDFEARPGIAHSGWPFDSDHMAPYYRRAQRLLELGPFDYDVASWAKGAAPLPLAPDRVVTTMFQFGPLDVVLRRRQQLADAEGVQIYIHATAQEFLTDDLGSRVSAASVATAPARRFTVRSQMFVLASGGIENARLLLLSTAAQRRGLGNNHDVVGRYFMDHPHIRTGMVRLQRASPHLDISLYRRRTFPDATVDATLTPAPQVVRDRGVLNSTWWLRSIPASLASPAAAALSAFREGATHRFRVPHAAGHLRTLASHPVDAVRSLGELFAERARGRWRRGDQPVVELRAMSEQAPNPSSRVTLGAERDHFGQPRARLDWRLTALDRESVRAAQDILDRALRDAGVGRVERPFGDERPPALISGGCHHMGTTRMNLSPRQGVVDPDCRVHGTTNLFVAGSSVFPTVGYANPTLTLTALSVRLADHLARLLA